MANLGFHQRYGPRASVILTAASVFPDIDSLMLVFGRQTYAEYHRGFTHALGGWIVCGTILALLSAHANLKQWFLLDWGLWGLGMVGHTAADLMTRWPIPVFYPFSDMRWSFAIVSWGDGLWTGFLLVLALAVAIVPRYRRSLAAIALGLSLIYLGYRTMVPAPGASWLSHLWFGFWMR